MATTPTTQVANGVIQRVAGIVQILLAACAAGVLALQQWIPAEVSVALLAASAALGGYSKIPHHQP